MLALERTAALLLAGGMSTRFGAGDKLLAPLGGKPLVAHAAELAAALPFAARLAVVPEGDGPLPRLLADRGFSLVRNPNPANGRESSLRLGLRVALGEAAAAILVLLGDMPFVTPDHIARLHEEADEGRAAISSDGRTRMPPVLVPAGLARTLLERDRATMREQLGGAAEVIAPENLLSDFDSPADFRKTAP